MLPLVLPLLISSSVKHLDDLTRARTRTPRACFRGKNPGDIAATLNRHLLRNLENGVRPCEHFTLSELDDVAAVLLEARDGRLNAIYQDRNDRRSLRHNSVDKWRYETAATLKLSASLQDTLRDGKCAELVMIWTHHITAKRQSELEQSGLILPLMSTVDRTRFSNNVDVESKAKVPATFDVLGVYQNQTTCSICHSNNVNDDPLLPTHHSNSTSSPPVWRSQFHVNFTEYTQQGKTSRWYVSSICLDYVHLHPGRSAGNLDPSTWTTPENECVGHTAQINLTIGVNARPYPRRTPASHATFCPFGCDHTSMR